MKAVLLCAVLAVGVVGCNRAPKSPPTPAMDSPAATSPTAEAKIYTREEFSALLVGKTQDQVIELVGKPHRTSTTGEQSNWVYRDRTRDTVTGKTDRLAHVWFRNGVVDQINY